MLAMVVGRFCAMSFVADVIATMIIAKWADAVTPCAALNADAIATEWNVCLWQMLLPLWQTDNPLG